MRETLERGGVSAPETIDVLSGKEWQYRNRIRLAFDGAGRVGYRARRSHDLVPISECPIASPLLVRAALDGSELLRSLKPAIRPAEISLFCNAEETELLASIFVRDSAARAFDHLLRGGRSASRRSEGLNLSRKDARGNLQKLLRSGAQDR